MGDYEEIWKLFGKSFFGNNKIKSLVLDLKDNISGEKDINMKYLGDGI